MNTDVLTEEEIQQVVLAFLSGNGPSSDEDILKAVTWAAETRILSSLLDLALKGELSLCLRNGQIAFVRVELND